MVSNIDLMRVSFVLFLFAQWFVSTKPVRNLIFPVASASEESLASDRIVRTRGVSQIALFPIRVPQKVSRHIVRSFYIRLLES